MKKIVCVLLTICFLMMNAYMVNAEESNKPLNEVMLLGNDGGFGSAKIYLNDKFSVTSVYEDELFKAGLRYDHSERFGIKAGEVYDHNTEDTFAYGGIDFVIPFGDSLNIAGFYDTNYKAKDWDRYETALKIQMFKSHFIYAGIRGDAGDSVPEMEYNEDNLEEPHLFLRGDFNWNWKKVSINLKPLLYVKGAFYADYTFKYHLKENASLVLNINNQYDSDFNFRGGFEFKF